MQRTTTGILCRCYDLNFEILDLNGIGRFLAAFSMLCAKQSREWEDCVRCCIVNLLSYSKIMNSFIRVLIKTGKYSLPLYGIFVCNTASSEMIPKYDSYSYINKNP